MAKKKEIQKKEFVPDSTLCHSIYFATLALQTLPFVLQGVQYLVGKEAPKMETSDYIGAAIAGVGFALGKYSLGQIAKHFHNGENGLENTLATKGIYSMTRNPIYGSFRLANVGSLIANPTIPNAALTALAFAASEIQARTEEDRCERVFGDEYNNYKERVPRWIPNLSTIKEKTLEYSSKHPTLTSLISNVANILS